MTTDWADAPDVEISFTPQAWVHYLATTVDAPGETDWTAPLESVLQFCGGQLPDDDQCSSDGLRYMPQAPAWTRDWAGPFAISILNRDEIEDYLGRRAAIIAEKRQSWTGEDPWEDHPDHPSSDWMYEVSNGDTRRGYVDWVQARMEAARDDDLDLPEP